MKGFGKQQKSKKKKENDRITKQSVEKIRNKAIEFHIQGKIIEARNNYKYLIGIGLPDPIVFANYGIIQKDLGNLQEAELYLRKAIELNPNFANAHFNLGNIFIDLDKLQEAELSIRKAIELDPDFENAHSNLAGILKDLGKLKEAELSIRRVIELNPNFANAHSNLGVILRDLGKLKEAELSIRKAIELDPDFADAYLNLGNILRDLGQSQKAELSIRKAIELNPDLASAHYTLGSLLQDLGEIDEAITHWEKAYKLKPEEEQSVIDLAYHLCYEGKYDLALKFLSKTKSDSAQSLYLECLLSLDREKDFNKKYNELCEKRVCNANIGGVVEHANIIYGNKYRSPFCNEALKYVLIEKINEESFSSNHLNDMISYNKISKNATRAQGLLTNGIQTSGNLFSLDYPFVKSIRQALIAKIELYKNKFKHSGQGFIENWPENYELKAWMISMKNGGFLKSHNHEYGWITGSFYLQIPKYSNNVDDSGKIAFSYKGPRYPTKEKNFNLVTKKIETRDICIFPSSLFHHTIPFKSSEERICFVFDLTRKKS